MALLGLVQTCFSKNYSSYLALILFFLPFYILIFIIDTQLSLSQDMSSVLAGDTTSVSLLLLSYANQLLLSGPLTWSC